MNVLVIAAHPDDEVLGCGGVMARHEALGDRVDVLVVTRGIPELFPPEVIEGTRKELQAAHRVLGVSGATFLDLPAPRLDTVPGHEVADAIRQVIRELDSETVYIPHRGDLHTDHGVVHRASLVGARPTGGCPVRRLLCYETLSETEWGIPLQDQAFVPTVFADISDYLPRKLEAMGCYRSQLARPPASRTLQALEHLARLRGATVGVEAAEAFMLMRHIEG